MVKIRKKSKRQKLSQKYNIEKKIRAHNKKMRRTAKEVKHIVQKRNKKKKICIPNSCPYKEQLISDMQKRKEALEEEKKEKKRLAKLEKQKKNKEDNKEQNEEENDAETDMNVEHDNEYERFLESALQKQSEHSLLTDESSSSSFSSEENGYIIKKQSLGYMKDIYKMIEMSDVLLEVLDARNPNATRNLSLENYIQKKQKKIVLILNKVDLVPKKVIEGWLSYLRVYHPTIGFKCASIRSNQKKFSKRNIFSKRGGDMSLKTASSEVLGFSSLMHLLKNYSRVGNSSTKKQITVGVFGYPNVGKSSLINSIIRNTFHSYSAANSNAAHLPISFEPNCTKHLQFFQINKHIQVIDTPGVVKNENISTNLSDLILQNVFSISKIKDPKEIVEKILQKFEKEKILKIFNVPNFDNTKQFLYHLAMQRSRLSKNGVVDFDAMSRMVLKEWMEGKIKFFVQPPKNSDMQSVTESRIVEKMSPSILLEFDEIYKRENDKEIKAIRRNRSAALNGTDFDMSDACDDDPCDNTKDEDMLDALQLDEDSLDASAAAFSQASNPAGRKQQHDAAEKKTNKKTNKDENDAYDFKKHFI